MLIQPVNYQIKNQALAKQPVYVLEVFFAGGSAGVDGTNDIYFASCDVREIVGFPYPERWFPVLQADSISGLSQSVDPINGVSTIGTLSVKLADYKHMVSDIFRAADVAGHGLRRQRINLVKLFRGMDWADRLTVRTLQVQDLVLTKLNEYTLTAADVQTQMKKTIFNPVKTTLSGVVAASGGVTLNVADARTFLTSTSVTYGASGFIKVNGEIMRWTSKTTNTLVVPAAGRGMFGTSAAAHAVGDALQEIIYLNENPITMALKLLQSSGVAGTTGNYDAYPAHWGCAMDNVNDVAEADWLLVGELLTGLSATHLPGDGLQFEFVLDKGVEAKKFIEDDLLKIIGAFGFVRGDGQYSIRAYNDLANAAKENAQHWFTVDNVVSWGDLKYDYPSLANELWLDYDEYPKLSGKYIRSALFLDGVSKKKWGDAKQLKYATRGVPPTSTFVDQLYQRWQRVAARYSRPPMRIQLTLLPSQDSVEIGDICRVTLPIRDLLTGDQLDRAFEVLSTQIQIKTGEIVVDLIAQPEVANFWFQGVGQIASVTISPATTGLLTGGNQQMVARCFDASGMQVPTPAISWQASGNVTIDSAGVVTAGAIGTGTVRAIVGTFASNTATINVVPAGSANPVASVSVSPSAISLSSGQTQAVAAQAFDATGNQVLGVTFNWASSNPAVATVPPGPSASAVVTAVADGAATITATETGSSVASPAAAVTVAAPPTPTYQPPFIADSAYQIGTKITTMGPVGGPHVIPNGYNFAAGDYWFDGNVTLPLGSACTINGTVRIFSLGVVTINGVVNGKGRGLAGAGTVSSSVSWFAFLMGMFYRSVAKNGVGAGFVGKGGSSASVTISSFTAPGNTGGPTQYAAPPVINVIGTSTVGGSWAAVSGLPTVLHGSSGATGCATSYSSPSGLNGATGATGGTSGAGLLIMARGIYIAVGQIDLRGNNGSAGSGTASAYTVSGSGAGGGGSLICLAERNINGLPVMSIDAARCLLSGGVVGPNVSNLSTAIGYTPSYSTPQPASAGALIAQVIG